MSNSRISRKDKLIDNIDKAVKHVRMFLTLLLTGH